MTPIQNLYYAIGEIAYAIAFADGAVQKEERERFHSIVTEGLKKNEHDLDISEIIFQVLSKDRTDSKTAYDWALKQIRLNSHYLSPQLKETFQDIITKVAEAYPPVTEEEMDLVKKFEEEISPIVGDPVYYGKHL